MSDFSREDDTDEELLAKDKQKVREKLALNGLKLAMSTIEGRAFLWTILQSLGFHQTINPESIETYNFSVTLYDRVKEEDFQNSIKMVKENTA